MVELVVDIYTGGGFCGGRLDNFLQVMVTVGLHGAGHLTIGVLEVV